MSKLVLDSFVWSFSKINSYKQCPRMFKKIYIDCLDKVGNAFAEWGTFGHDLLERYYKQELEFFELSQYYEREYKNNVKLRFPPNAYVDLNKSYYDSGKEYFDNFEGLFDGYEVLGIEQEINIKIGEYDFIGYIDLILRSEEGIIVVDHKSKSKFKSKKEKKEYLRQLYLYSIYIYDKYKVYPSKLIFNMFRVNNIIEEKFDIAAFEESKQWCIDTIQEIYNDIDFSTKSDNFFCNWLCSARCSCSCSDKYIKELDIT